jgi:hypothetical protein
LQTQQQGSLSILLLQAAHGKDIPGYHAWLERSPNVLPLATFRAGQTAQAAAHWYTAPSPQVNTTKQFHMVAVFNQKGASLWEGWCTALEDQLRACPYAMDYDGPKLDKKPSPMSTVATLMTLPSTSAATLAATPANTENDLPLLDPPPPLLHDWKRMCYTDGSRHLHEGREVTGAGYYVPEATDMAQEQTKTVFPKGKGVTNTILRAELTGILVALHGSVLHFKYAMWRPYYSELAQLCWARAAHYSRGLGGGSIQPKYDQLCTAIHAMQAHILLIILIILSGPQATPALLLVSLAPCYHTTFVVYCSK